MKTMLAAYLPGNSTVDLREVAVPTPGINQVGNGANLLI